MIGKSLFALALVLIALSSSDLYADCIFPSSGSWEAELEPFNMGGDFGSWFDRNDSLITTFSGDASFDGDTDTVRIRIVAVFPDGVEDSMGEFVLGRRLESFDEYTSQSYWDAVGSPFGASPGYYAMAKKVVAFDDRSPDRHSLEVFLWLYRDQEQNGVFLSLRGCPLQLQK